MNLLGVLFFVIGWLTIVQAEFNTINHDQVQPFAQPKPVTASEKTAIKYKPQLHITYGCYPYPVVQADGAIGGSLKFTGPASGDCEGSPLGSQVYARSTWYNDKWAIMYAWYFSKGADFITRYILGHRHYWEYAIVWIDNPALENSTILGVSVASGFRFQKKTPPKEKYVDGSSVKLDSYYGFWRRGAALRLTEKEGETQDLIMWKQLTDEARAALTYNKSESSPWTFSGMRTPLRDGRFTELLEKAWSF